MAKISTFGMNAAFQLGFKRIADVRGITSVVSLFKNSMILSGIYLQIRPDNTAYIGKTNNMPARFEQHLARGVVIEELAFMPVLAKYIDEKEKQLITLAEKKGIPLDNLALRESEAKNRKSLNSILKDSEIDQWLSPCDENPVSASWLHEYNSMHPGLRHQLDLARAHPVWSQIFPVAKYFVQHIIPQPQDTCEDFWSAGAYTRNIEEVFSSVIRIHAGSLTLLNLGSYRAAPFEPWGWIECSKDHLMAGGYTPDRLKTDFPYVNVIEMENFFKIGTSARLLLTPIEKLKKPLRQTTLAAMNNALLQKGNPALHALLYR